MPSNTFPPPSTTSNDGSLFFHRAQEASRGTQGGVNDDKKTYRTYIVNATFGGRLGLRESEVPQPELLTSLDFFSQISAVDHPPLAVQSLGLTITPQDISQDRRNNKEHHLYLYDIFVYIFLWALMVAFCRNM